MRSVGRRGPTPGQAGGTGAPARRGERAPAGPSPQGGDSAPARRGERGDAIVEFVAFFAVLLVALVQLIYTLARVEAAQFAAEAAARDAARVLMRGGPAALPAAHTVVETAFADQGFTVAGAQTLGLACVRDCGRAGGQYTATVSYQVSIPLVGALLPSAAQIDVSAHYAVLVGRYESEGGP